MPAGNSGIAARLAGHGHDGADDEDPGHGREDRPALSLVAGHAPERVRQAEGDDEDGEHLQPVGQAGGVLEGMGRVGVERPAAVGAQLLDDLLGGEGAAGDDLLGTLQRGRGGRAVEGLR